jgi:hypothetical protein
VIIRINILTIHCSPLTNGVGFALLIISKMYFMKSIIASGFSLFKSWDRKKMSREKEKQSTDKIIQPAKIINLYYFDLKETQLEPTPAKIIQMFSI